MDVRPAGLLAPRRIGLTHGVEDGRVRPDRDLAEWDPPHVAAEDRTGHRVDRDNDEGHARDDHHRGGLHWARLPSLFAWAWPLGGQLQRRNEMSAAADYVRFYVTVHTKGEGKLTAATEKTLPKGSGEGNDPVYRRAYAIGLSARGRVARLAARLPVRVGWSVALAVTVAAGGILVAEIAVFARAGWPYLGGDLGIYTDAAHRWLGGGGWYLPFQLTGPYPVLPPVVLYPPHWLIVLVPFALGLPAILWWLVPATAVAWSLYRLRPAWWSWPLILGCCVWPRSSRRCSTATPRSGSPPPPGSVPCTAGRRPWWP
jgi:hypothetical protein